jgi:enoyl-[acyl-carrier protein] reductase II
MQFMAARILRQWFLRHPSLRFPSPFMCFDKFVDLAAPIMYVNQELNRRGGVIMNAVTELLGCQYPIVQGAMGVICNPELVAAVSEAGGFGLLATVFTEDPEIVRNQIKATKALTKRPFGANLFIMNPLTPKFVDILYEEGVQTVTVSAGSPKQIIPILHERDMKCIVVVPSVAAAKGAEAAGADAIVAEGGESGGVQGFNAVSTLVLVPAVVDAVKIPVLAAGGIGDARAYRAALALGAEGVQVGTRFIASKECVAHKNYKQTIVDAPADGTGLLNMGRFQVRSLRTPLVENLMNQPDAPRPGFVGKVMEESWISGDLDAGPLAAGQVSGLISSIPSVEEIIQEMVL